MNGEIVASRAAMMTTDTTIRLTSDDTLVMDYRPILPVTVKVTSWHRGLKVISQTDEGEIEITGDPGLHVPLEDAAAAASDSPELARWLAAIPEDISNKLTPYIAGRFVMLRWIAESQRAAQLLNCRPLVLWLCAININKVALFQMHAEQIFALPLESLMAHLPAVNGDKRTARRVVKFLSKVKLDKHDHWEASLLVWTIDNAWALELFDATPEVTPRLLVQLARMRDRIREEKPLLTLLRKQNWHHMGDDLQQVNIIYGDCLRLADALGIDNPEPTLSRLPGIGAMRTLHDRWVARFNITAINRYPETPFPPVPVDGNAQFEPLINPREVALEGKQMSHCAATYIGKIQSGDCYLYRVNFPERATLELRKDAAGKWTIAQLKRHGNKAPSPKLVSEVENWLKKSRNPNSDKQ